MYDTALVGPVEQFVATLSPVLASLAARAKGVPAERAADDVTVEAAALVAAVIDADGLHTDDELRAYVAAFANRLDTQLIHATPADVRASGLVAEKRSWLSTPSAMFQLFLAADRRERTRHAWSYYEGAMRLAFTAASLDAHTSRAELAALEAFRSALLAAMDAAGVPRPGQPWHTGPTPAPAPGEGGPALHPAPADAPATE